jgi:hypothetical protein
VGDLISAAGEQAATFEARLAAGVFDHCAQYGRMYFDCARHHASLSRESSIRKFAGG